MNAMSSAERQARRRAKLKEQGEVEILVTLPKKTLDRIDALAHERELTRNACFMLLVTGGLQNTTPTNPQEGLENEKDDLDHGQGGKIENTGDSGPHGGKGADVHKQELSDLRELALQDWKRARPACFSWAAARRADGWPLAKIVQSLNTAAVPSSARGSASWDKGRLSRELKKTRS